MKDHLTEKATGSPGRIKILKVGEDPKALTFILKMSNMDSMRIIQVKKKTG
jgi:hypothetical protein